jgi:hypothetical protein
MADVAWVRWLHALKVAASGRLDRGSTLMVIQGKEVTYSTWVHCGPAHRPRLARHAFTGTVLPD